MSTTDEPLMTLGSALLFLRLAPAIAFLSQSISVGDLSAKENKNCFLGNREKVEALQSLVLP